VYVSGTTALGDNGQIVGGTDPAAQMRQCLLNIESALTQTSAALTDVVRTRIYVTDISAWERIGQVHAEFFDTIRPATSMIEVSRLIAPEILIEVEAEAYVD